VQCAEPRGYSVCVCEVLMAVGANSYGTVAEVEALTKRYTVEGVYTTTSLPTILNVEAFLDRVSSILNVLLAEAGFTIPVSQADAKLALDDYAVDLASVLCHAANGAGPLAPGNAKELRGRLPREALLDAAAAFVSGHADGLQALGAARTKSATYGLQVREEDDDGVALTPFFERD